jgi:hypothetical protein
MQTNSDTEITSSWPQRTFESVADLNGFDVALGSKSCHDHSMGRLWIGQASNSEILQMLQ